MADTTHVRGCIITHNNFDQAECPGLAPSAWEMSADEIILYSTILYMHVRTPHTANVQCSAHIHFFVVYGIG